MSDKQFDDGTAVCCPRTVGELLINVHYGRVLPEKLDNLLAAGRCISVDTVVHNYVRLIPGCMATGQAAAEGVTPTEIDRSELRAHLAEEGVY